jgi:hypothetical protein
MELRSDLRILGIALVVVVVVGLVVHLWQDHQNFHLLVNQFVQQQQARPQPTPMMSRPAPTQPPPAP